MSKFLRAGLRDLTAYTPGEQPQDKKYIKLNTNESPYPPGPQGLAAIREGELAQLRLYPDPRMQRLKEALAAAFNRDFGLALGVENVFLSNGSDDILNFAFAAFAADGGRVLYPEISYGFYEGYAKYHKAAAATAPLDPDFRIDTAPFLEKGYALKILANPNAPTGIALPLAEVEAIAASDPDAVFLVDEAYVDFGAESAAGLLDRFENLLICRTFSKSSSLAGARLGYALGSAELIADLALIQYSTNPYSVNRMSEAVGLAVLAEPEYYKENARRIMATREQTAQDLRELGLRVLPSGANFLFAGGDGLADPGGKAVYEALKERGVLVRYFGKPRLANWLRISIGTPEEMAVLIRELKDILGEA